MILRELLPRSVYGTIGTISGKESIDKLTSFFEYNLPFINSFPKAIFSLNTKEETSDEAVKEYMDIIFDNVKDPEILLSERNRGHTFGTMDLENDIIDCIKNDYSGAEFLFKTMDDVVTYPYLLDTEIPFADFYYLPGFSYESIMKAGSKENLFNIYETFESGFWTPQTTFYIIRLHDSIDLYGDDIDNKFSIYQEAKKINSNIKPWEIEFDIKLDCESHLGRSTKDLRKYCLLDKEFNSLLDFVEQNHVGDPAHKNIFFKRLGLCHYHFYDKPVYEI